MGIGIGVSRCSVDNERIVYVAAPNPNPRRFKIQNCANVGSNAVAVVRYEGCTNYEGLKVMVYRNVTADEVQAATILDPHFCEGNHLSPFARFEPTEDGFAAAIKLAKVL